MARFNGTPIDEEPQAIPLDQAVPLPQAMQAAPATGGRFGGTPIPEPAQMSTVEAFARGAEQGATFGFGDEARGIVAASPMMDDVRGSNPVSEFAAWNVRNSPLALASRAAEGLYRYATGKPGAEQRYDAAVGENRTALKQAQEQHPWATSGGEIAGGLAPVLATGGAGLVPRAATTTGRLAQGAGLGAAAGGTMGVGQGEGGIVPRAIEGAKGAAVGGVFGLTAEAAMGAGRGIVNRFFPRDAAPQLTPDNIRALSDLGLDPARIGDRAALDILGRAQQAGGITPATLRQASAGEFGVPLTRGQATGGVGQTAFEEAARADARGNVAGNVIRGFDSRQREAIDAASGGIQQGFAGDGRRIIGSVHDAGESTIGAVRSAEAEAERRIGDAYREAGMRGTTIKAEGLAGLPDRARSILDAEARVLDPLLTPATLRGIAELESLTNLRDLAARRGVALNPGDEIAGISLEGLENSRRRINSLFDAAQNRSDRAGVRAVKRAFDQHMDEAIDRALLSGDETALAKLKEARGLRAEYGSRFERRGTGDDAGGLIERILQRDVTPNEVANWTLGNASLGASPRSVRLVERLKDILGEDSQAWSDIRQAAWQRITTRAEGKPAPGPQAVSSSISEFLNGRGRDLAEAMFSPAERQQMERFAAMQRNLVPPEKATNRSGTGYEVARAASPWAGRIAGGLGLVGSGGNPAAAGALMTVAKTGSALNNARKAGQAIQPVTAPQPSSAQAAILAGLLGADQRELASKAANDGRAALARALMRY